MASISYSSRVPITVAIECEPKAKFSVELSGSAVQRKPTRYSRPFSVRVGRQGILAIKVLVREPQHVAHRVEIILRQGRRTIYRKFVSISSGRGPAFAVHSLSLSEATAPATSTANRRKGPGPKQRLKPVVLGLKEPNQTGEPIDRTPDRVETRTSHKPRSGSEIELWYGTNRIVELKAKKVVGYKNEPDEEVHLGKCRVFVPKSHRIGSLGSRWWKRALRQTDDRLSIGSIDEMDPGPYWEAISRRMESLAEDDRHAVVFIHGFRTSFKDAALRTAQIGTDLAIKGAMAFFSWPSRARARSYLADQETIEACEEQIANFLVDFATRSNAKAVHVIAHSMGNRGLLRAMQRIANAAGSRSSVKFDQIILAAPDVDVRLFKKLHGAYIQCSRRTTLYVSTKDKAVALSQFVNEYPRVGYPPPLTIQNGIDTILVRNAGISNFGHGYVGDARHILKDMHALIMQGLEPVRRFGVVPMEDGPGREYWAIGR